MKENKFTQEYLNILKESTDPKIDELVKENSTTIDENSEISTLNEAEGDAETNEASETTKDDEYIDPNGDNINNNEEDEEDDSFESGWGTDVKDVLSNALSKMDDISYEIKNCTRGSLTGCTNVSELKEYLKEFAKELNEIADSELN